MAQSDLTIQNQSFPSFRSDLNDALTALNTTQSGTSRPSSAVAGTIWLDTTNATSPTLKLYDGGDDISLATLDYSANTVNWLDSTVSADLVNDLSPQLGGMLDVNGQAIGNGTEELIKFSETASAVNEVTVTNSATGNAPEISATGDDTNIDFKLTPKGTGKLVLDGLNFPTADGTTGQFLKTDGSGNLSFASVVSSDYVLLATSDITIATASVSFDGYYSSTYKNYKVIISDLLPATNSARLRIRFRQSNADVTSSDYHYTIGTQYVYASGNSASSQEQGTSQSSGLLTSEMSSSSTSTNSVIVDIFNPLSSQHKGYLSFSQGWGSVLTDLMRIYNGGGMFDGNTTVMSGVSFYMDSGNLTGNFKLYGIK